MSENPSSNKFSSFVGITLLIAVISFTVFVNFFAEIGEEIYFEPFSEYDLANFWSLEGIDTEVLESKNVDNEIHIQINKKLANQKHIIPHDSIFVKLDSSVQEFFKTKVDNSALYTFSFPYGELQFKNNNTGELLELFAIVPANDNSTKLLNEIGNIILKYQIQSITTQPEQGDFTEIEVKDGRKVILIKENAEVKDKSYKNLLENAEYLNDSTRIILPWN
jgi:hypothetical protein